MRDSRMVEILDISSNAAKKSVGPNLSDPRNSVLNLIYVRPSYPLIS